MLTSQSRRSPCKKSKNKRVTRLHPVQKHRVGDRPCLELQDFGQLVASELDRGIEAGNESCGGLGPLIGVNGVCSLGNNNVSFKESGPARILASRRLTGGICSGSSTVMTMERMPFSMGHSRATFLICSHRSALVEMRRIRPYLTVSSMYAPSSMVSFTVPTALMTSSFPLQPPELASFTTRG